MKSLIYGAVFFVLSGWGAGADLGPDVFSMPSSSSLKSHSPYTMKVEADPLALARVLCLDGGGGRGIYTAAVLDYLEEELQGKRVCDFFQGGITGTSTGSLIALAILAPTHFNKATGKREEGPYPANEIVDFYEDMIKEEFKGWTPANCWRNVSHGYDEGCFSSLKKTLWSMMTCFGCCACYKNCDGFCGPRYSNHSLRAFLERHFGDLTLADALVPAQIVSYDVSQNRPIYFSSFKTPKVRFVDAALCSSAAPTYFPSVSIEDGRNGTYPCVDGGVFDNSACLAALKLGLLHSASLMSPASTRHLDNFVLLSIGTGEENIDSRYKKLKHSGKLRWASDAIKISMEGTSKAAHENLQDIYEASGVRDERYFRIQTILTPKESQMDNTKESITEALVNKARNDVSDDSKPFRRFVRYHIEGKLKREIKEDAQEDQEVLQQFQALNTSLAQVAHSEV